MLCLAKQVCKLLITRSQEGTRGRLSLYLHSLPLFLNVSYQQKNEAHWDKQTFMYEWSDIQCSHHKERKPLKANGLLCPKENPSRVGGTCICLPLLLSTHGLMEDISFLFCQSCLSSRHWIHFNQSHRLLTRHTRKAQHVSLACTYVFYLLKHQLFTLCEGQMLRRWNPLIVPLTSVTMLICTRWASALQLTFSSLSHI